MKVYILSCMCFFLAQLLYAQHSEPKDAISSYFDVAQAYAAIYNGKVKSVYPKRIENHPYFISPEYTKGTVSYGGKLYPNVSIRLDLYVNDLEVLSPNGQHNLVLQCNNIDYAILHNSHIIYLHSSDYKGLSSSGYYLLVYDGDFPILKKQSCTIIETIENQKDLRYRFSTATKYYVQKDSVYYEISNKKSILSLFKSHKKELNHYAQQQKLDFKKAPQEAIVSVVKQYELLTNQP